MVPSTSRRLWLAILLLGLGASVARAETYLETFDTDTYKDPLTTAVWDTGAGEAYPGPFVPSLLYSNSMPLVASSIEVFDFLACVGSSLGEFMLYDVHNPSAPVLLSSNTTFGSEVRDAAMLDSILLVVDGSSNLRGWNVTNPSSPSSVLTLPMGAQGRSVEVVGGQVYVGAGNVVRIYSAAFALLGQYDTGTPITDLRVEGNLAAITSGTNLHLVDLTDPFGPSAHAVVPLAAAAVGAQIVGHHVYASSLNTLYCFDTTVPTAPTTVGTFALAGPARNLEVTGERAFVAASDAGVQVIDIQTPSSMSLVRTITTAGTVYDVAPRGGALFVASQFSGLQVWDWASTQLPSYLSLEYEPNAVDVVLAGDRMHAIADQTYYVYDITQTTNPVEVGSWTNGTTLLSLEVEVGVAYVVGYNSSTLTALDVRVPAAITVLGTLVFPENLRHVDVQGTLGLVTSETGSVYTVSVAKPAAMSIHGSVPVGAGAADAILNDGATRAYARVGNGVYALDVSDPTFILPLGVLAATNGFGSAGLSVSGRTLLSVFDSGVQVLDSVTGALLGTRFDVNNAAGPVARVGNALFYADQSNYFTALNLSNPSSIQVLGYVNPVGSIHAMTADAQRLAVATDFGLWIYSLNADRWSPLEDRVVSLPLPTSGRDIASVRITPDVDGQVSFFVRIENSDFVAAPDPSVYYPGLDVTSLAWSAEFSVGQIARPTLRSLAVNWHYAAPNPVSVIDVPDDQGGWARLRFERSGYDATDVPTSPPLPTIFAYNVYRQVGAAASAQLLERATEPVALGVDDPRTRGAELGRLVESEGGLFVEASGTSKKFETLPPGVWEIVGSVFATTADEYLVLVPTLADSSAVASPSTYVVSAHSLTPGSFFVSDPIAGFSTDDIAPGVPAGLTVGYASASNTLQWQPSTDDDLQYFNVYRGTSPGFTPSAGNRVGQTAAISFLDGSTGGASWDYFYKISAVDHVGNESGYASPVTATGAPVLGNAMALYPNVPNPFNPRTTIALDLPRAMPASVRIYDLAGRLVSTLHDGGLPQGRSEFTWEGIDTAGKQVASGGYFCKLETMDGTRVRKLTLAR